MATTATRAPPAPKSVPLPPSETIKQAVGSPETCTSATALLLNDLLFPSSPPSTTAKKPTVRAPVTKKKPTGHTAVTLTTLEKYRLATEIVNSTLKTLSAISKQEQVQAQGQTVAPIKSPPGKAQKTSKMGSQPLQSRNLNTANTAPPPQHPAIWIAECCRIAISYIYSIQSSEELPAPPPTLQIETAQHNLIIRLIILKIYSLALKELKILKKRLDAFIEGGGNGIVGWTTNQVMEKDNKRPAKTGAIDGIDAAEAASIASLLVFRNMLQTVAVMELVVGFQMSVMRCVMGMNRQNAIESLIPSLAAPHNPLSILKALPNSASKLLALDSLISGCCPPTSSSADAIAKNPTTSPCPRAVLQLQAYALEARILAKGKKPEEVWEILLKYMSAFCRRCTPKEGGKERYRIVREIVLRYQKTLVAEAIPENILQILATVAQEAGYANEALKWLEQANSTIDPKIDSENGKTPNDAAKAVRLVKVATLCLKAYSTQASSASTSTTTPESIRDIAEKVRSAVESVDVVAKVTMDDLERLLQEVALFRRAAAMVAISSSSQTESSDITSTRAELRDICVGVSESAVKFFRKYISIQPNDRERVRRFAVHAVDFVSSIVRQDAIIMGEKLKENWDIVDTRLFACLDLMKTLVEQEQTRDNSQSEEGDVEGGKESSFERVSGAYWKVACALRKLEAQREWIIAMKRSVIALSGRPKEECIRAGLVGRLERLGNAFYQAGDITRAEETFIEGIEVLKGQGVIDTILDLADNAGLSEIFGQDRAGMELGRILDGILKCAVKDTKKKRRRSEGWDGVPFDDETLNRETRGLILEWQLRGLCGLSAKDDNMIKAVVERLMGIYTDEEPLRRARVISRILKIQVDNPAFMDRDIVMELGEEVEALGPLHRDASLKRHRQDIVSSCLVSHAFLHYQSDEPRPDLLKTALLAWQGIAERCNSWDRLLERIENPEDLITQLYMLMDFFEMKGLSFHRIAALRTLVLMKGLESKIDYNALIKLQSLLGTQYLRMGYSGKAGMALAKAMGWTEKEEVDKETKVQWHLAYTEYLVGIGNTEKAGEHYNMATQIVGNDTSIFESQKLGSKLEKRVSLNRMIADASYVLSLLSFETGNSIDSISYIRRCIRLNQRSWAVLEQLWKDPNVSTTKDIYPRVFPQPKDGVQTLIDNLGRLSVKGSAGIAPPVQSTTFGALKAPLLWTLVTSMYLSLVHASLVYRHQGMIREAMFNMDQALKTVEAVGATPLIAQALSIFGDLKIRAGAMEEGADMLEKATELRTEIDKSKEIVNLDCSLGHFHGKQMLWEEELEAYDHAEAKLEALMSPTFIRNIDALQAVEDPDGDIQMAEAEEPKQSTKRSRTSKQASVANVRGKATATSKAAAAAATVAKSDKSVVTECSSLLRMRGNVLRLKAYNLAMQSQCQQADLLLKEAGNYPSGHHEVIYQRLAAAKHLLIEGLVILESDPVFCVLQDSTISLPSVAPSKLVKVQEPTKSPAKKSRKGSGTKDRSIEATPALQFVKKLTKARDSVAEVHSLATKVGSTAMAHSVSMLLSGIIVLLSAVTSANGKGNSHPLFASYSLELNKGLPLLREKDAVEAEKVIASSSENLSWPRTPFPLGDSFNPVSTPFPFSNFQKDYIDIIPQGWAAVSISLSEAQDELYISRFQAGQGQFMIRLPLSRHNSQDKTEEIFEYKTGIDALREIMEQANLSTHAARDATTRSKVSKAEWWAEREALDNRFGELLANIEHCWLGGFKGIFGQFPRHQELLKKFRATFERILAKHLPSRQPKRGSKKGGSSKAVGVGGDGIGEHVRIDPRLLDLFVGVGDPGKVTVGENGEEVEEDIEAPLTDLLWFVFDILQFHGESNAYDEIDIDAMMVDITEAIRSYHQSLSYVSKLECEATLHTILILDKSLHQIPWESLPCLDGHAISRLPSMASLREILAGKQVDYDHMRPGVYVDGDKGTWILNPSGDLKSTQTAFEKDLLSLPPSWTGISCRPPTELEFSSALENSNVLLYFGHGSGAQFIRSRTVKKLNQCAVSLLMGCSSGALKEAGEFQPYGMPLAYLLGGSPAIVANLWDVTDKDIDRFSRRVLGEWGLFKPDMGETAKGKGRSRSKSRERGGRPGSAMSMDGALFGGKGKMSLVEAVALGRKECHLKYLNGAAPVVYGVPVYLA